MDAPRVMLITGTRKGIGRKLVEYYLRQGYLVAGCSREAPDWSLPNYTHHLADVGDEKQVKNMLSAVWKQHRALHVVINNAGLASMNHCLLTPVATVDRIMATNFRGTFLVCRESAKFMQKQRCGRIVNFSTVAVPFHLEGEAVYAASKSAVEMYSRVLAFELAEFGITCNVVAPALIETDLTRQVPPEKLERIVQRLAIKRWCKFEDVANVIDFFIKPESGYVTGQVIYLGGV